MENIAKEMRTDKEKQEETGGVSPLHIMLTSSHQFFLLDLLHFKLSSTKRRDGG